MSTSFVLNWALIVSTCFSKGVDNLALALLNGKPHRALHSVVPIWRARSLWEPSAMEPEWCRIPGACFASLAAAPDGPHVSALSGGVHGQLGTVGILKKAGIHANRWTSIPMCSVFWQTKYARIFPISVGTRAYDYNSLGRLWPNPANSSTTRSSTLGHINTVNTNSTPRRRK